MPERSPSALNDDEADEIVEGYREGLVGQPDYNFPPPSIPQPGVPDQPLPRYIAGRQSRPGLEPGVPAAIEAADPFARMMERLEEQERKFETHEADYDVKLKEQQDREEKLFQAREADMAPRREAAMRKISEPIPEQQPLQQLPTPPDPQKIRREFQDNATGWMFAATAIMMFGAAKSQNAATAGLQAMEGLFTGLREGQEDKINEQYKIWKEASDTIVKTNRAMVDEYKQVLNNRKLEIDQTMQQLELVAAKWQSQFDYEALRRKNLVDWDKNFQNHEKQAAIIEKAMIYAEMIKERADIAREKKQLSDAGFFSPEEAMARVERYIEGGAIPYYGLGRSGPVRDYNAKLIEKSFLDYAKQNNWTQAETMARRRELLASATGLRTAYNQEARITYALNEIRGAIGPAKEALDIYWGQTGGKGIGSLRWNQLTNWWETEQGSPELGALAVRLNEVMAPYSSALARTGQSTDQLRAHAAELLSVQKSSDAAKKILDTMYDAVDIARRAGADTRAQIQESAGHSVPSRAPSAATPSPKIPQRPANVPQGSAYSPSRNQWRAPGGTIYDATGNRM